MLTIKNVTKLGNRKVFANWVVRAINCHPVQGKYMFDIQCMSPIGVCMDRCTVSLERRGKMLKTMTHPTTRSYFFYYNGTETNVCGGADWLADMDNFTKQLEYIIKEYHNKK